MFTLAKRTDSFIKLALSGPSGSGKSYSALRLTRGLIGPTGKFAYIDTENGSAKLYSSLTEFYHYDLTPPYECKKFMEAIKQAEKSSFDAVIIDSLSHLWTGTLDYKSNLDRKGGNSFSNWNDAGKHFNEVMQAILQAKIHVIACLRVKTEYLVQEETNSKGKVVQVPKKVGTSPVIREGIDYELSLVLDLGMDHYATTAKDRTGLFVDKTFLITEETGEQIAHWLQNGSVDMQEAKETVTSVDYDTDYFLQMIDEADSKDALGVIGLKIKESHLSESDKNMIRNIYRKRSRSLA